MPQEPDAYPAYLGNRVYQGSSGQIFPLPFHERISSTKSPRQWDAIHLENEWVRLMILPELGGRIHIGVDKSNGYDFFYRNNVIKPALVGLTGPWLAGGVEFNWPQHHRPGTFLPTDAFIEYEDDGAVTVWCSDHDPFARMKGMHGIRLRPGSNVIEARVRLFNRTTDAQTFLWWANVAAAVGDDYQSFFPTDVTYVADHAKRAITAFPAADRPYYGIDYPDRVTDERPDGDRIDWYRNVPVPTSYMCIGTQDDFFGGYDHGVDAGFVHWADHLVAPGKKMWSWGDAPFGHTWDDNLTDTDGPYIELMAGVFTDNQPDFTYLAPGETKTFSQYWYPIQRIGAAHQATLDSAVRLDVRPDGNGTRVHLGVAVTQARAGLQIDLVDARENSLWQDTVDADPGRPVLRDVSLAAVLDPTDVTLVVSQAGADLLRWTPRPERSGGVPEREPEPAREPVDPQEIASSDELYLTGVHLEQYRHATRSPEPYWEELLARDPLDARGNTALAARRLRAGRFVEAELLARTALDRQTALNPNPRDGEVLYLLGQICESTGRREEAYAAYGKAAWSAQWKVPAWLAMARIDAAAHRDRAALSRVESVLAVDAEHVQARDLAVVVLRRLDMGDRAAEVLAGTLSFDPGDWWARDLAGEAVLADGPTCVDIALEYVSVGDQDAALRLFEHAAARPLPTGQVAVGPLAHYYRADLMRSAGDIEGAAAAHAQACAADGAFCQASRREDAAMLVRTVDAHPDDARAWLLLGNWLYSERRHDEAIHAWRRAAVIDSEDTVARRNLAVASFNVLDDPEAALRWYAEALALAPRDPRLIYESDQLDKRLGKSASDRLVRLERLRGIVGLRDDLTVELVELLTATGRADEAREVLRFRHFQPWEGGEGRVLGAWDEALLALAREALAHGRATESRRRLEEALDPPANLGEARHPLANAAHILLALGTARADEGDRAGARRAWTEAATFAGDFRGMETVPYSEMTYYSVLAARHLDDIEMAERLERGLAEYVAHLRSTPAKVDYFATSLPTMLLFSDDLAGRQVTTALLLDAQLAVLRGGAERAQELVAQVLDRDPNQVRAIDLARELGARVR
nr:DUF5107 domain-containing protein [Paraoerskovia sediminicola]